jgi:SEC-C motif domain protein
MNDRCPCGWGDPYTECCGRYHAGDPAPTAEALMRSRYSAFVLGKPDYLLSTWAPENRPGEMDLDEDIDWQRLVVLRRSGGGPFDTEGTVEFEAWYRYDGRREVQHEDSLFRRDQGRWVYVGPQV